MILLSGSDGREMCPQLEVTMPVVPTSARHIGILVKCLLAGAFFLIGPAFKCMRGKKGLHPLFTPRLSLLRRRESSSWGQSPDPAWASLTIGRGLSEKVHKHLRV